MVNADWIAIASLDEGVNYGELVRRLPPRKGDTHRFRFFCRFAYRSQRRLKTCQSLSPNAVRKRCWADSHCNEVEFRRCTAGGGERIDSAPARTETQVD